MNFLACDLGGTKVLLGIFKKDINDDSPKLIFKKKYLSSNWESFELILEDFLKNQCKNIDHPSSACFAVAGPLSNNQAKIINLSWNISGNALQNKFNLKSCELINDFAVQIYGIPYLKNTTPEWSNRGKMRNTFIPAAKEQFGSSIDDKLLYMSDSLVSYNKLLVDKVFKPFYESVISLNLGLKVNIGDFVDMDIHFWQNILTTLFHSIDVCKPSIKSVTNFTEALKRRKKGAINLTITTYCYIDKNNDLYILKTDTLLEVLGVMSLKKRGWSNIKGILTPCIDSLV